MELVKPPISCLFWSNCSQWDGGFKLWVSGRPSDPHIAVIFWHKTFLWPGLAWPTTEQSGNVTDRNSLSLSLPVSLHPPFLPPSSPTLFLFISPAPLLPLGMRNTCVQPVWRKQPLWKRERFMCLCSPLHYSLQVMSGLNGE